MKGRKKKKKKQLQGETKGELFLYKKKTTTKYSSVVLNVARVATGPDDPTNYSTSSSKAQPLLGQ